jgi:hypothetical protein
MDKEEMEFIKQCKYFMVFFTYDEDNGRLAVYHYVGFQDMPTPSDCEEVIAEINSDPDWSLCEGTDYARKAIVELSNYPNDLDYLIDIIVEQLVSDMGLSD